MKKCYLYSLFSYSHFTLVSIPEKVYVLGHEFVLKELFDEKTTKKYKDYQRVDKPEEYLFKTYLIPMPHLTVSY